MTPSPASRRLLGLTFAVSAVGFLSAWVSSAEGPPTRTSRAREENGDTAPPRRVAIHVEKPGPGYLTSRPCPAARAQKPTPPGTMIRTGERQRRRLRLADGSALYVNANSTLTVSSPDRLDLKAGEVFVELAPRKAVETFVVRTPKRELRTAGHSFAVRAGPRGTEVVVASGSVRVVGVDSPVRGGQQLPATADKPSPAPRVSHSVGWVRDLMAASPSLVPASSHSGGSLVARDPEGQEAKLALRKYHVDVHVEGGFARTTVDQTYFNHTPARLEGTFYFPLPADASLSRLAMYVDGRLMEGGMAERDYARAVYERIVYQQKDPALLEWVDGTTFKMRVFPLEPRQEKRVLLSYTQRLPGLYGRLAYRFPAGHSLGRVANWSFHARVKGGAELTWDSPSHALKATKDREDLTLDSEVKDASLDTDVVLTLGEAAGADKDEAHFTSAEQDGAKYLMVRYRPALPASKPRSRRDWVFLVETSGDRDPLLARTQVEVVRALLDSAEPDDTFAVLTAGTRTRAWSDKPVPVSPSTVGPALEFLEKAHLVGALDLGRALSDCAPFLKLGKSPCLVHVGSGIPAMGERRPDALIKSLPKGAQYVGVGVGRRWNRALMKSAAERTAGYFTQINPDEPVDWRGFELAMTLNTPRLLDVRVADGAGKVRFLPFARMLAQGEELAAVARVDGDARLPEEVVVTGRVDGKRVEHRLKVGDATPKAGYLPRAWAGLEIERLLAEDAAKHKDRVVALSKAMYVMTPFTSLLVLEDEDMYRQFKVDRGRKDHWATYPAPARIKVVTEPEEGQLAGKGFKPTARQVLQTLAVRSSPEVLRTATPEEGRRIHMSAYLGLLRGQGHPAVNYYGIVRAGKLALSERLKERKEDAFLSAVNDPDLTHTDLGLDSGRHLTSVEKRLDPNAAVGLREMARARAPLGGFAPAGSAPAERLAPLTLAGTVPESGAPSRFTGEVLALRSVHSLNEPAAVERSFVPEPPVEYPSPARARERPLFVGTVRGAPVDEDKSADGTPDIQEQVADLLSAPASVPSLLYHRPTFSTDDRLFYDLLAYAPGLNTSAPDVRAVLEDEALPDPSAKPGTIAPAARDLFAKARAAGWQSLTVPAGGERPAFTVSFDGRGRYAWERTLANGLRERVACDGTTLWHLYPDLGLAARRAVSRFHRLDLARLVPWALPKPEDLARGADLIAEGPRTVALVPPSAGRKGKDGKPRPYVKALFLFDGEGRLAERRLVEMPGKKVLLRETCSADGVVKVLDADGKEVASRKGKRAEGKAPDLKPDTRKLVVLDLPFRSPEHVQKALKVQKKNDNELTFAEARALLTAFVAAGNGGRALQVFQQALAARDQHQLGHYVLLASAGVNLDSEHADVLARHPHDPLAHYLALHSSPVLRKHASQWAAGSSVWGEGFLKRLALAHALCQRWQSGKALGGTPAQRRAERDRALAFVRKHKGSPFAWALLGLVQDRTDESAARKEDVRADYRALAEHWQLFEPSPALSAAARYEQARCLVKGGRQDEGRKRFLALYDEALKAGTLLRVDSDFRRALLGGAKGEDGWNALMRRTATHLLKQGKRPAVLTLAAQCWQVDDQPLAGQLFALAMRDPPEGKERLPLQLAGLGFLWQTGQFARADGLLRAVLAEPANARHPALWRLAADLAGKRDMPARQLECLEKALDAEYADLPTVINLQRVRADYEGLLDHYQNLAQALVTLKLDPPAGFTDKVVRAADRWRSLDREAAKACQSAARVLQMLGQRELAWDYLTTPVALRPNESDAWSGLAGQLKRQGEPLLADRAFRAAFEAEPTNAQLLWGRAENLRQAGRLSAARALYRRLAEGDWQPRFGGLVTQARWALEGR